MPTTISDLTWQDVNEYRPEGTFGVFLAQGSRCRTPAELLEHMVTVQQMLVSDIWWDNMSALYPNTNFRQLYRDVVRHTDAVREHLLAVCRAKDGLPPSKKFERLKDQDAA